ncbi:hypothetical protein AHAS_Ahas10G0129200 [Arachis hypogaea]
MHEDDSDVKGRIIMLENRLEQLEYKIELGIEGKSKKWRNQSIVFIMMAMLIALTIVVYVVF